MRYFGYHRTSTTEQHLDRGLHELNQFAAEHGITLKKIYTDQQTGKNFDRPSYKILREVLDEGDVLIITEMDRLGRNKQDTMKELQWLKVSGIRLMVLEIPTTLMDLSNMENDMAKMLMETVNNMLIEVYVTLAEAEMHKKEKRQREGLDALKARGEWDKMGRPVRMYIDAFKPYYMAVMLGNMRPSEVMKRLNLKKSTYYRYMHILQEQNIPIKAMPIMDLAELNLE